VVRRVTDVRDRWLVWMFGAGLFANCVSFLGVSYFGKPLLMLMLQLGVLGSLEAALIRVRVRSALPGHGARNLQLGTTN
jgi:hypothetical protein